MNKFRDYGVDNRGDGIDPNLAKGTNRMIDMCVRKDSMSYDLSRIIRDRGSRMMRLDHNEWSPFPCTYQSYLCI